MSYLDDACECLHNYARDSAKRELRALRSSACALPGEVPGVDLHRLRVEAEARRATIADCVAALQALAARHAGACLDEAIETLAKL